MSQTPTAWKVIAFLIGTLLSAATFFLGVQTQHTSEALRDIEESRSARERRDAEVTDFVGSFYAAPCLEQVEMEQFPLRRAAGIATPVDRQTMLNWCNDPNHHEPTRVLEDQTVVGRPDSNQVHVFATLRYANAGHDPEESSEIAYVDLMLERADDDAPYRVTSLAEVTGHGS